MTLTNSFVRTNNSVADGGGLHHGGDGPVTLTNTILTGNRAARGSGLFGDTGVTLNQQATVIIANTPNNCAGTVSCCAGGGAALTYMLLDLASLWGAPESATDRLARRPMASSSPASLAKLEWSPPSS